eukprot:TRINITY_DN55010_c0_g1_i1.p1 TRINITY_DN55010_c0_g1~~TRINITY_DN55010_c0_g1_i1.p1  ORF type:complete len:230 (-),score=62.78 TRINITY_DN55010_c0_g1_i1:65-754(-)
MNSRSALLIAFAVASTSATKMSTGDAQEEVSLAILPPRSYAPPPPPQPPLPAVSVLREATKEEQTAAAPKQQRQEPQAEKAASAPAAASPAAAETGAAAPGAAAAEASEDEDDVAPGPRPALPFGELEPYGREETASDLTEAAVNETNAMIEQLERAEVAEEKRSVFRALTRLRGVAISSFDSIANLHTGNIEEYAKTKKWRDSHPLQHLALQESDTSKWAFPEDADFF